MVFAGRQIVREAVVQAGDGPRDRCSGELALLQRAIVVVGYPIECDVHHFGFVVGDPCDGGFVADIDRTMRTIELMVRAPRVQLDC